MTIFMAVALALAALGATATLSTYKYAPVSEEYAGWDFAFMGGVSTMALGALGTLLLLFTA